jgi:hypothetical protein
MPPPPKPASGTDDDRRRDAAAEAERLGREHSNKREMKARAERLRSSTPEERRTGAPGAPVVQPRRDNRPPEGDLPARDARAAPPRPAERAERPPERVERLAERAERPPERAERPPERAERPPERAERPPAPIRNDRPPSSPSVSAPDASVVDEVAIEAEALLGEFGTLWRRFAVADKVSIIASVVVVVGALLPWLKRPHEEVVLGVGTGGIVHVLLAVAAVVLIVRRDQALLDDRGPRPSSARQQHRVRRTALALLLVSLASTLTGIWFVLVYGVVRRFEVPTLEIGAGLYLSLAAGLGLSYSGFAYFWRASRGERA